MVVHHFLEFPEMSQLIHLEPADDVHMEHAEEDVPMEDVEEDDVDVEDEEEYEEEDEEEDEEWEQTCSCCYKIIMYTHSEEVLPPIICNECKKNIDIYIQDGSILGENQIYTIEIANCLVSGRSFAIPILCSMCPNIRGCYIVDTDTSLDQAVRDSKNNELLREYYRMTYHIYRCCVG